jgi:hypothetical protein
MKRNAWTEQDFRKAITQAGHMIHCSWGVVGLRSRTTGEIVTALIFRDDDNGEFAHAFEFRSMEEITFLCRDLMIMGERIEKGEFKK